MIDKPGIYDLTDDQYFSDPCPTPSLSSSIAKILLAKSPLHAWYNHRRLNPSLEQDDNAAFNLGKAAHDYLMKGGRAIDVIDEDSWRSKAAQEAKALILASGRIPLLRKQFYQVEEMTRLAEQQIALHEEAKGAYQIGHAEQTCIWQEPCGIWCRAKLDWLETDKAIVYDHKTTSGSAHPNDFIKQLFGLGYDVQAAFYLRGLKAVFPAVDFKFRFTPQEVDPPYCLSVIELPPAVLSMAERKVETAIDIWHRCVTTDEWPAYSARTYYPDIPVWAERAWLAREEDDMLARESGVDPFANGMKVRL